LVEGNASLFFQKPGVPSHVHFKFLSDGDIEAWQPAKLTERVRGAFSSLKWHAFSLRVGRELVALAIDGRTVLRTAVTGFVPGETGAYAFPDAVSRVEFKDLWLRELSPDGKPLGATPK
jgi:hypothetical protein